MKAFKYAECSSALWLINCCRIESMAGNLYMMWKCLRAPTKIQAYVMDAMVVKQSKIIVEGCNWKDAY